jgi:hypothetical protein
MWHKRQRRGPNLGRKRMIAGLAKMFGQQARSAIVLQAAQQTEHLTPPQAGQHTRIGYP